MRSWNLDEIKVEGGSRSPVVLDSEEAARAVLIVLDPGQSLGEHQVKEHAYVLILDGRARVEAGGEIGRIAPGYAADLVLLAAPDWRYLSYHLGGPVIAAVIEAGEVTWTAAAGADEPAERR